MGNSEAGMWRTLCKELLDEDTGGQSFNFMANYDHIISTYPPVFIQKMAIIAADRSISRKDYDTALSIFDALRRDNLDEPVKKYIDYMHAKILSETKGEEEAEKIWEQQASNVEDPLTRARAEFSLVNMLLSQQKITPEEATRRLETLRIVWRGDSLELNVLMLLGNIYIDNKQYSEALHTLRDIVLYYPTVPEAVTTAKKMEEVFVDLYNKGGADSMPPLDALSLFYEFRDLVPLGKDGDLMIRNLADRLVNIDLLDRASLLLDHQIRKRLTGEERSRVGARLALIYLLNHQSKEALETLKTTGYGNLPADLQLTRIHLTAQALAQQKLVDKAIDVLSNDTSNEGSMLRLNIYWDNKDWPNVVSTAEEILGNRNEPSASLTPLESDVLLKLATAYVYEHDSGQIQYLRDYFTPLLKAGPNKDSFLFITSESGSLDYKNLANLETDISAVKSFLDAYRDKVKKNGLSNAIN
jgi:tetratricopeptide (TPR) repeat protein